MISLCSSNKPLRPHPPSTYYRFVMKPYAKMWVWKHSFPFRLAFCMTFSSRRLGQTDIKNCCSRVIHCTGLNRSKSQNLFLRMFIMFSNDVPTNLWEIVTIAHQLFFPAVVAIHKKYSGGIKRDCTDSIFYIL